VLLTAHEKELIGDVERRLIFKDLARYVIRHVARAAFRGVVFSRSFYMHAYDLELCRPFYFPRELSLTAEWRYSGLMTAPLRPGDGCSFAGVGNRLAIEIAGAGRADLSALLAYD
jgi:hypothetical protein